MKASSFSDAQKAFILKQGADGVPVADICRRAGISQATYFNWKKKCDGMPPPDMRRLKQLEDENAKLRKLVADLSLDKSSSIRLDAMPASDPSGYAGLADKADLHTWQLSGFDPRAVKRRRCAMRGIRLPKLPDRTPVKLSISILPDLHQRLKDYAAAYAEHSGSEESVAGLVPAMLAAFLDSDREFAKYSKGRAV